MKKMIAAVATVTGLMAGASAHAELIVNGGFEGGLSNWSCTGADLCTTTNDSHSGSVAVFGFDNSGYGVLSQTIATSIGSTYDFSVYSKAYQTAGNQFGFSFSDLEHATFVPVTTGYTQSTASFVATSDSTLISLYFATTPGTGTVYIDDVSVTAAASTDVPEPATLALFGLGLLGVSALRRKA